jgi:hypothetical protein
LKKQLVHFCCYPKHVLVNNHNFSADYILLTYTKKMTALTIICIVLVREQGTGVPEGGAGGPHQDADGSS